MPLKHSTETFLVLLLGIVLALTGIVSATLPELPLGIIPWGIAFAASIIYPLILSPLFRKRRADKPFRLLHWVPALLLLVWLGLELPALFQNDLSVPRDWYTWGWALPTVAIGFILTAIFCHRVIRRRTLRLWLLAIVFVPFAVAGVMSEQTYHWEEELAALIWQGDWWQVDFSGGLLPLRKTEIAQESSSSSQKNLENSEDPDEESYREQLRAMERREERIRSRRVSKEEEEEELVEEKTEVAEETIAPPALSGTGREIREADTLPKRLPQSGGATGVLGVVMLAGYLGTLHQRARKRLV